MTDAPEPSDKPGGTAKRLNIDLPAKLALQVAGLPNKARVALAATILPHLAAGDPDATGRIAIERLAESAVNAHRGKIQVEATRVIASKRRRANLANPKRAKTRNARKRQRKARRHA